MVGLPSKKILIPKNPKNCWPKNNLGFNFKGSFWPNFPTFLVGEKWKKIIKRETFWKWKNELRMKFPNPKPPPFLNLTRAFE